MHFQCEAGHTYALKSGSTEAEADALNSPQKVEQASNSENGKVDACAAWITSHDITPTDSKDIIHTDPSNRCEAKVFVKAVSYID